eukprot:TRINITY_DN4041_c0_g1_i1.p1 TRINITY_DN4041_c0_g1~~TRINITY_DN4041_c0_g1_i1.p1  ORF type:complete len:238 (+),score=49.38 TRINITY_DN4041_c0_g1_i1:83-796(+)
MGDAHVLLDSSDILQGFETINSRCRQKIEDEYKCDVLYGPDDDRCVHLFFENEDCFQQSLCEERWREALSCVRRKDAISCKREIARSRNCKNGWFRKLFTPQLTQYMRDLKTARLTCEEQIMKHTNCADLLGEDYPECVDRELIRNDCILSNILPIKMWVDWKKCQNEKDNLQDCYAELDDIRYSLHKRAEGILLGMGFKPTDVKKLGGGDELLEYVTKITYSGHADHILKDYDPRQ